MAQVAMRCYLQCSARHEMQTVSTVHRLRRRNRRRRSHSRKSVLDASTLRRFDARCECVVNKHEESKISTLERGFHVVSKILAIRDSHSDDRERSLMVVKSTEALHRSEPHQQAWIQNLNMLFWV